MDFETLQVGANWYKLPWRQFGDPIQQWETLPSFLAIEYTVMIASLVALWHATRTDKLMHWIGSIIGGTCNDTFFMLLPFCDNFWQGQGTIMLTPRMPLYIPAMYSCFMYYSIIAASRLCLSPFSEAAAAGLLAAIFYGPYDICGPRFLWWTWHDTDPAISKRILNAPCGSTIWILTYTASFCFLLRFILSKERASNSVLRFGKVLLAGITAIPLFMVVMSALQFLSMDIIGIPGPRTLFLTVFVYSGLVFHGLFSGETAAKQLSDTASQGGDRILYASAFCYFCALMFVIAFSDPQAHVSTGVHQVFGDCGVISVDIMGYNREENVCAAGPVAASAPDYSITKCGHFDGSIAPSKEGASSEWYTVCGVLSPEPMHELGGVMLLCSMGIVAYGLCLLRGIRSRKPKRG
ncbi:hypothetical protein CYMTET_20301 [Cymbomonas tetramitiformis]|uniref:DUF7802 domain-containing protein n=1 Tax=Cymbomonas tetramitiformis TaxID=36881 RepID=A0AAE0G4B8_9CHLO|nr:hypothetical protein CYMTET_20301 [Cymbomonas tetramitiformis]